MRPPRQVPYDFECHRILSTEIRHLDDESKEWPKYRFGTLTTSPVKYPDKVLTVHYRVEFTSNQSASVEFAFTHPRLGKEVKHTAEATLGPVKRKPGTIQNPSIRWYLHCPYKKHKWCFKTNSALWLGREEKLSCQNCAGIKRYSKIIEGFIIKFRKDPSLIPYTLSKAGSKESQKKYALIALEKLYNKFKKMTDNYALLTVPERNYYSKLRVVLFPSKKIINSYQPSVRHEMPLPFQANY